LKQARTSASPLVLLGHVTGAHGIRGEVSIKTYTGAPEDIGAYGSLCDEQDARSFDLKVVRVTPKGGVIARIKGIDDRTAAEALKGIALHVARAKLPQAAKGEFYHADLIGLAAIDLSGRRFGRVVSVRNFGAGDLLELALDGSDKTEFVTFTLAVVPEIDIAGGRLVVVMPEATEAPEDPERPGGGS